MAMRKVAFQKFCSPLSFFFKRNGRIYVYCGWKRKWNNNQYCSGLWVPRENRELLCSGCAGRPEAEGGYIGRTVVEHFPQRNLQVPSSCSVNCPRAVSSRRRLASVPLGHFTSRFLRIERRMAKSAASPPSLG